MKYGDADWPPHLGSPESVPPSDRPAPSVATAELNYRAAYLNKHEALLNFLPALDQAIVDAANDLARARQVEAPAAQ